MKRIEGRAKTVRELLHGARFAIDFYQREYAWQERQVRELVDDLTGKFLDFHDPSHEHAAVEDYGHYFLGPVVVSHKQDRKFVVDGQQRLTTLTLFLIFLHHLQQGIDGASDVVPLIHSTKFGRKSFNLDVPERNDMMHALLDGRTDAPEDASQSVQNIAERYRNITEAFPEDIPPKYVPRFVDWLLENVHLIEIEAYSDEDAYTIFETMNDRGLSLSLPEMLKGYVLANIRSEDDQREVNSLWKRHMQSFREVGDEQDADFFKNWLRARHAETIRASKKGAENRDYERIGSEFHRWVRDHREDMGLASSSDFVHFVKQDLDFYGRHAITLREASRQVVDGLESVYFNEDRGLTLQHQVILAALSPADTPEVVRRKMTLVADYLDIWLARRVWNFRTVAYSSIRYTMFNLTKDLRERGVDELGRFLREQLEEQEESFVTEQGFRLHGSNYTQVRHVLARLTHWLEGRCGLRSHFEDLVAEGRARRFEVEHVWADHFDRFSEHFAHVSDFEIARNRIGGLLVIQRGLNQSLGDATYEAKVEAYATKGETMLARSLHPSAYENNPGFKRAIVETGLDFHPYERFGPDEQAERQELFMRMAEWVWNPSRLDADGEKPPTHEPLVAPPSASPVRSPGVDRHEARARFWHALLPVAWERQDLHDNISPGRSQWVGAKKHGQYWNYTSLESSTRVALYIDSGTAEENKALFDRLHADRELVESAFGGPLHWQRLDDKMACRISHEVEGGWGDESTWPAAIDQAVDAMGRLYDALGPRVEAARGR